MLSALVSATKLTSVSVKFSHEHTFMNAHFVYRIHTFPHVCLSLPARLPPPRGSVQGDLDVLVGFEDGSVSFYENTANNATAPTAAVYTLQAADLFGSKDSDGHANAAPW